MKTASLEIRLSFTCPECGRINRNLEGIDVDRLHASYEIQCVGCSSTVEVIGPGEGREEMAKRNRIVKRMKDELAEYPKGRLVAIHSVEERVVADSDTTLKLFEKMEKSGVPAEDMVIHRVGYKAVHRM